MALPRLNPAVCERFCMRVVVLARPSAVGGYLSAFHVPDSCYTMRSENRVWHD